MVNKRGKEVGRGRPSSKGNKTSVAFGRSVDVSSSSPSNATNKNTKPEDVSGGSEKITSVPTSTSTIFKHTAASLAKKATTVGKKIIKETRNVKIERKTDTPTDETEAHIEPTESKKVSASIQRRRSPRFCKTSTTTATKITKQECSAGEKKSSGKKVVQKSSEKKAVQKSLTSQQDMELEAETTHYIKFIGFDDSERKIGACCCLCEKDLGEEPVGGSKIDFKPIVAILPCGHVYHSKCLNFDDVEAKQDPPCVFCASLNTQLE